MFIANLKVELKLNALIKPKVELINQEPGVEGLFKHMELCARTCYKSEDKITEDSARSLLIMSL